MTINNSGQAVALLRTATSMREEILALPPEQRERAFGALRPHLLEAAALFRKRKARQDLVETLLLLASFEKGRQHNDDARALAEEAVSTARTLGDAVLLGNGLRHLGEIESRFGRTEQAEACYREALHLFRRHTPRPVLQIAHTFRHLARLLEEKGSYAAWHRWEQARQWYHMADAHGALEDCRRHIALIGEMEKGMISEQDRTRLANVIRGRPVCLVLPGHSLKSLPQYIDQFPDVCFGSVNRFWAVEPLICPRKLDLAMVICESLFPEYGPVIEAFPGLLISLDASFGGITYGFPDGNSLLGFLKLLIKCGVERVFLFGADGYSTSNDPYVDGYAAGNAAYIDSHRSDTAIFNSRFPRDHAGTQIFNVSVDSKYTVLPKISYQECVALLHAR